LQPYRLETTAIFSFQGAVAPLYGDDYVFKQYSIHCRKHLAPKNTSKVHITAKRLQVKLKNITFLSLALADFLLILNARCAIFGLLFTIIYNRQEQGMKALSAFTPFIITEYESLQN
jgi:hypothetical protein